MNSRTLLSGYQLMFFGRLKNQSAIETFEVDLNSDAPVEYNPDDDLKQAISTFKMSFISSNLNNLSSPIHSAFLASGKFSYKYLIFSWHFSWK